MPRKALDDAQVRAQQILGSNLRARREHLDVSQERFAHQVGLNRTQIGRIERAEIGVTLATLVTLADGLDCSVADLVEGL